MALRKTHAAIRREAPEVRPDPGRRTLLQEIVPMLVAQLQGMPTVLGEPCDHVPGIHSIK
jgi:hypothetical protein